MKIVLFGATGMIGQGVLRALIDEPRITRIEAIVRQPLSSPSPKVHSVVHRDFTDFTGVGDAFLDVDACCFCLGVSSAGMSEAAYTAITYDVTAAAADALYQGSPNARFLFVSGASTDATEKGPVMWARVKGRAENTVRARFGKKRLRIPAGVHSAVGRHPFADGRVQCALQCVANLRATHSSPGT